MMLALTQVAFAQNKNSSDKNSKTNKTSNNQNAASNLVGLDWKLSETEKWGVIKGPTDDNKNDHFILNSDETFVMFLKKRDRKGTWKKTGNSIQFTCEDGEKLVFKILKSESGKLKVDWREDESMNTIITFTSGK